MNRRLVLAVALVLLIPMKLMAQMTIGEGVTISFASVAEGKQLLTNRDEFVKQMSPFDRAARLKTDMEVSENQFLEFVGRNVVNWIDAEKQKINSAFQGIQRTLEVMALPFPEKMLLIKTTGNEEGGAPYTRGNAIVLPPAVLNAPVEKIQMVIAHELFHIMSRANPALRERLYAAIGFVKCNDIEFPKALKSRKLTNPDSPRNDHCIRVKVADKEQWAIPILLSKTEKYDLARGGEFFNYLELQLLLVDRSNDGSTVTPMADGLKPMLVDVQQVSGFFEQVGRNTQYIIHPEEILADNFVSLVRGDSNLASPEVADRIQAILKDRKTAAPGAAADANKPLL